MAEPERFAEYVIERMKEHNRQLEEYSLDPVRTDQAAAEYCAYARRLAPHLVDGSALVGEADATMESSI